MLKSDNANGLFGYEGPCLPFQAAVEGDDFSCSVKRARGDAGFVTLAWRIEQLINNVSIEALADFNSSSGETVFSPGQLRAVRLVLVPSPTTLSFVL